MAAPRSTSHLRRRPDDAEISARPADTTSLAAAGNLRFEIGDRLVLRDATISTESPNAGGGHIDLAVSGVVDMRRSSITTSVTPGLETGGNVTLRPGSEALVLDRSRIIVRADAGAGGSIDIESGAPTRRAAQRPAPFCDSASTADRR